MAILDGRCARHAKARRAQVDARRPNAVERGYGNDWRVIRAAFLKDNPSCAVCGAPATDVDHVVARRSGGSDDRDNLVALCHSCHSRKTAKHDHGWGRG